MRALVDITGLQFNAWTVISRFYHTQKGQARWNCVCVCGTERVISSWTIRNNRSKSCGCLKGANIASAKSGLHASPAPLPRTCVGRLYSAARTRAKRRRQEFDLKLEDIIVPEKCPVLGITLMRGTKGNAVDESPSLDRVDNSKGYVKGNVWVISNKANRLKGDANLKELQKVVTALRKRLKSP